MDLLLYLTKRGLRCLLMIENQTDFAKLVCVKSLTRQSFPIAKFSSCMDLGDLFGFIVSLNLAAPEV